MKNKTAYPDQTRNINKHKAAVAARFLFGREYAAQSGGTMDFWDTLSDSEKNLCRDLVDAINESRDETMIEKMKSEKISS